jgi:hypothetical protein
MTDVLFYSYQLGDLMLQPFGYYYNTLTTRLPAVNGVLRYRSPEVEYIMTEWGTEWRSGLRHCSAIGVTIDSGLIPGCITTVRDRESHRTAHNWPCIIWAWPGWPVIVNTICS